MTKFSKLFLIFAILISNIAFADSDEDISLISVTGSAELYVEPDEVHVSLMIQKDAPSLREAQRKNNEITSSIIRIMKKNLNIDKKNIKTDMINVQPIYEYTKCGYKDRGCVSKREFSRFEAKKGITVKLTDDTQLQTLLDKAIEVGVTNIQGIKFTSSKFQKLKNKAQVLAAIDAKERAKRIAGSIGSSIGAPHRINVNYSQEHNPMPNQRFARSEMAMSSYDSNGSGETIAAGQLKIKATVSASFKLED